MRHATHLTGLFYRMKFQHEADDILGPARAPHGRAHYPGQRALYLSRSPEGTVVASRIYVKPDDPVRCIFCLKVENATVIDLRDPIAANHYDIDTNLRLIDWKAYRDRQQYSPTWVLSDRIRELGFDGMLYASRSDPENTVHLTLFKWNEPNAAQVSDTGDAIPWSPPPL